MFNVVYYLCAVLSVEHHLGSVLRDKLHEEIVLCDRARDFKHCEYGLHLDIARRFYSTMR